MVDGSVMVHTFPIQFEYDLKKTHTVTYNILVTNMQIYYDYCTYLSLTNKQTRPALHNCVFLSLSLARRGRCSMYIHCLGGRGVFENAVIRETTLCSCVSFIGRTWADMRKLHKSDSSPLTNCQFNYESG